jgi:hypothetical protein
MSRAFLPPLEDETWQSKKNRRAYHLPPFPAQDELVYAYELSLDRFIVRFELECLLEICGWGNDGAMRRRARTIEILKN